MSHTPQELRVMLQSEVEPIVLGPNQISSPPGRPWRVITITSVAARRKNFERPSRLREGHDFGVVVDWRALLIEPALRLGCRDDRESLRLMIARAWAFVRS